jgi:hypothetical protein
MSRGFGPAYGLGTADKIVSAVTTQPAQRSFFIWSYRFGHGGGSLGRLFDQNAIFGLLDGEAGTANTYRLIAPFSVTAAVWAITAPAALVWSSLGVRYDHANDTNTPTFFLDGAKLTIGAGVTATSPPSGTPTSVAGNAIHIGNRAANDRHWDGMLAEPAIWDGMLTDDEFLALARGTNPRQVQRPLQVEYMPLVRNVRSEFPNPPTVVGTFPQPHAPVSIRRQWMRVGGRMLPIGTDY